MVKVAFSNQMTVFSQVAEDFIVETIACFSKLGAPFDTTRVTQAHLEEPTPKFIKKDEWSPQSPDCNPMNYAIYPRIHLQTKTCRDKTCRELLL